MRKIAFVLIALFTFNFASAQNFDLSILDKALDLSNKGKSTEATGLFNQAIEGITKETKGSNNLFASKLTGELGGLTSMLSGGNKTGLPKIISTIKTLIAANRLKNMLGGGSLLGKGKEVSSNTSLLSSGLSLLSGGNKSNVSEVSKLLGLVSKNSSKLDQGGVAAKAADKLVSENLGSSLSLLEGFLK